MISKSLESNKKETSEISKSTKRKSLRLTAILTTRVKRVGKAQTKSTVIKSALVWVNLKEAPIESAVDTEQIPNNLKGAKTKMSEKSKVIISKIKDNK